MSLKKMITKPRDEQKEDFKKIMRIMKQYPNHKLCGKCYDLGYIHWDVEVEYYVPCSCLLEKEAEITNQRLILMDRSEN